MRLPQKKKISKPLLSTSRTQHAIKKGMVLFSFLKCVETENQQMAHYPPHITDEKEKNAHFSTWDSFNPNTPHGFDEGVLLKDISLWTNFNDKLTVN